jgi:hypothetical protein
LAIAAVQINHRLPTHVPRDMAFIAVYQRVPT